ncbi:hypothetical protein BX666DRAFT_1104886 [Dichotomocladium elegans]|nr:hypothetical protein BX666DRAFT_1104886 [Dichotomocladium elegans]
MEFTLLSRLDDFLCDTFLDCFYLWFSTIKMSKYHRRPNIQSDRLADIVYRRVICANDLSGAISEIFRIPSVIEFRAKLTEAEEIEFNSHMKRYLCMYLPTAGYEISDTDRYGGVEARVIATKDWRAGDEIRHCTGVITCLDPEQDRMLKAQNRDFSVMWSTRKNTSCLFLGPARFLNHDCESNTKFMPFGENGISFKVIRNIACGEEITTFYGEHYFGENNSECLCVSCEK